MNFTPVTAAIIVGIAAAALILWAGLGVLRAQRTQTDRLAVYGREALRSETLSKPLSERAIAPVVLGLGRFVGRVTPAGWLERTQRKLVHAGLANRYDANAWAVIKMLTTIAGIISYVVLVRRLQPDLLTNVLLLVLTVGLGFFGPSAILERRIEERAESVRKALPDVLDLLVISVEAGLGFDAALARVVETVPGHLSAEFFRMLQETRVGVARREAMRHLMERLDVEELRSFLMAMIQAEAFGVTISRVLRVQAEEMRIKRRQRAQEKAFAAPVKLVFPLVVCIFPSMLIVLAGPAAISVWRNFFGN